MEAKSITAVEWLYEKLWSQTGFSLPSNILEQANKMFEQQIIDANRAGVDMIIDKKPFIIGEQYYNETYGN